MDVAYRLTYDSGAMQAINIMAILLGLFASALIGGGMIGFTLHALGF